MTIENLTHIINGQILNNPSISSVTSFAFEAKNIKRGYALIATQSDQIAPAIKQGAYAIISEEDIAPSDDEIAFIKVASLQTAIINPFIKALLEKSHLEKNAHVIPENLTELFYKIFHANLFDTFFSDDTRILQRLSLLYETAWTDTNISVLNPSSIFFTTLIYDDKYYQNLSIPRVFAGMFCGLLGYLKKNNLGFKVTESRISSHFDPVFIDKDFKPVGFGSSFRAVIAEEDEELFLTESIFLRRNFSERELKFCLPKDSTLKVENAIFYENLDEIKKLQNFVYALVLCKKEELLDSLSQSKEQSGLF